VYNNVKVYQLGILHGGKFTITVSNPTPMLMYFGIALKTEWFEYPVAIHSY
jgi:hypothetical protein